jgi:hypothetical protein
MRLRKVPKPAMAKPPLSPEAAASVKAHREERKEQRQERKKRGRVRAFVIGVERILRKKKSTEPVRS